MAGNVLITGVSKGLGNAMARLLLERENTVFGLSRSVPENLAGQEAFHFTGVDLADLGTIEDNLSQLLDVQQLDLLILNAGIIGDYGDLFDMPLKEAKKVEDVNLWANKVILDFCRKQKINVGQVVAISSGASVSGARGWSAYGVSKAALNMLIRLYAAEMPETHFCSLAPGVIDTDMQEYLFSLEADDKYTTLGFLQAAKGEGKMPTPDVAAKNILDAFPKIRETIESGAYADIRKL